MLFKEDPAKYAYMLYATIWICISTVIGVAIVITQSAKPLFGLIVPLLINIRVPNKKQKMEDNIDLPYRKGEKR